MRIHIENNLQGPAELSLSTELLTSRLAAAGIDARSVEISCGTSMDDAPDADVLFACHKLDIGEAKRRMPSLRWVQVISAGVEGFLSTLPDDVMLTNASGVHGEKGGEFVLAAALMLNYRIPTFVSDKQARRWQPEFATPAKGKRVTLLGLGGIGGEAAKALRSRGFVVTGVTRKGVSDVEVDAMVSIDMIDSILPNTDILVSTLPLTPETRNLIDRKRLESLPAHAGVIVVGRAAVVDYDALADLLTAGRLGGAVLDVFPQEPLPDDSQIWACPNLIITPHCSVDDHAIYMARCLDIFTGNVKRFLDGKPLSNLVDRERGY
ncbi:D-2-hydroxyacid dehydrogenase [Rhizobium sp. 18055]|uniref:D-2-hydroxyacid dehydrogenase n=1 Tax=Rhizobium sp. 18055 TaxID=2681403 RepID=UPI001358034B|nr:D-2-hydroxyacid dehydrogenase [Rhizobium sp. 18055]